MGSQTEEAHEQQNDKVPRKATLPATWVARIERSEMRGDRPGCRCAPVVSGVPKQEKDNETHSHADRHARDLRLCCLRRRFAASQSYGRSEFAAGGLHRSLSTSLRDRPKRQARDLFQRLLRARGKSNQRHPRRMPEMSDQGEVSAGSNSASSAPSCTKSPTAHLSAVRRPSAGARSVCSIFIASSTRSGAPRGKSVPGWARIRVTVPGIGATMRLPAGASRMSAANG